MKKKILYLTVIALFFVCGNNMAQGTWTHFTKKDGLASTWVLDCLEDQQGNMWFATDNGLNKFDGISFSTFDNEDGLPGGFIKNIYDDKDGNIWILSGKNAYNIILKDVVYRDIGISVLDKKNKINALNVRQKEYLFGMITEDINGNIWLGGYNSKEEKPFIVKNFDGKNWEKLPYINNSDCKPFVRFFIDNYGNIWTIPMKQKDGYLQRFDGNNWKSYGKNDGFSSKNRDRAFQVLFEDRNGNLWFGASYENRYGSLLKFDGSSWTNFNEMGSIIGNSINSINEDNDGNIWIVTNKGINVFNGSSWVYYSEKDQLPTNIINTTIVDSKGRVWIGTAKGLVLFDNGKWSQFKSQNSIAHNNVRVIKEDSRGNIWVGAASAAKKGGISVYIDNKWMSFTSVKLPNFYTHDIFEDSKGNMWILTIGNGVFKYEY